jgi:hypothetical protein
VGVAPQNLRSINLDRMKMLKKNPKKMRLTTRMISLHKAGP